MQCIICEDNNWENVDQYRIKPEGMSACKSCGFISYPNLYKTKEEIREHYKTNYRNAPTVGNLYTGERKLHLHNHFLRKYIEEWNKSEKHVDIFEVGSAYGLFLNWVRHEVKDCTVEGSEWDLYQKRNAFHEFGLSLVDDIDTSKKYDLIVSYRVLEHQLDADKELKSYRECLNDGGLLYISVPTWFDRLHNHGGTNFEIDSYFSPNHINTWTVDHFISLFKRCGFEIVEHNKRFYDHTFMLKPGVVINEPHKDLKIIEKLKSVKLAADNFAEGKFKEATESWKNFPLAYRGWFETNRKQLHSLGYDEIEKTFLKDAINNCPESFDAFMLAADVAMRYGRFDKGIAFCSAALKITPESPTAYMILSHCYRNLYKEHKDVRLLAKARDICRHIAHTSSQMRAEAITWSYQDNANLAASHELKSDDKKDPAIASNEPPPLLVEDQDVSQGLVRQDKSNLDNTLSL